MKDLFETRFTIATRQLDGRAIKAISKVLDKVLSKYEPQITRIVDAFVDTLEEETRKDKEKNSK